MRTTWLVLLVTLAGCGGASTPECTFHSDCAAGRYCDDGVCTADCAEDAACVEMLGEGAACTSFGMCVAPPDAGPAPDAGPPRPDTGPPDRDAGVDAATDAGAPDEVCTPSIDDAVAADEDRDGFVDEGCPWHFGRPHAVPAVQYHPSQTVPVAISADGLRLYLTAGPTEVWLSPAPTCAPPTFTPVDGRCMPSCGAAGGNACDATSCAGYVNLDAWDCPACCNTGGADPNVMHDRRLVVATRPDVDAPFSPPVPVDGLEVSNAITGATLSRDELEIIFDEDNRSGGGPGISRATRASRTDPFGAPARLTELDAAGERSYGPRLTGDGLELFFTRIDGAGVRTMWHARRPSIGASFTAPARLVLSGPPTMQDAITAPTPDGRSIFFVRHNGIEWRLYRADRAARTALDFSEPVELAELAGGFTTVAVLALEQRELWLFSNRAWAAGTFGVFRVQVCRDGPCSEPLVPCATGTRSPDGFHCYFQIPGAMPRDDAAIACATAGAHLVTLHSAAEAALADATLAGEFWTGASDEALEGGWRWDWPERAGAEEPWLHRPWGQQGGFAVEPIGGRDHGCATWADFTITDGLNDRPCANSAPIGCEDDLWPTW